jgi:hypothetical protein
MGLTFATFLTLAGRPCVPRTFHSGLTPPSSGPLRAQPIIKSLGGDILSKHLSHFRFQRLQLVFIFGKVNDVCRVILPAGSLQIVLQFLQGTQRLSSRSN